MKFTTATFVACAAIFATQQADAKIARGVLTPAPGVKGPGGDGMILVRGGRGWRSVHPITGRTCFPGPDDGPICICGKGEICTQESYIGCATGKCESVQQRRLRHGDTRHSTGVIFRENGDVVHPRTGVIFHGDGTVTHTRTGVVFHGNGGGVTHTRSGVHFSADEAADEEDTDDLGNSWDFFDDDNE